MIRIEFFLVRKSAIHSGVVGPEFLRWVQVAALTYYLTKVSRKLQGNVRNLTEGGSSLPFPLNPLAINMFPLFISLYLIENYVSVDWGVISQLNVKLWRKPKKKYCWYDFCATVKYGETLLCVSRKTSKKWEPEGLDGNDFQRLHHSISVQEHLNVVGAV